MTIAPEGDLAPNFTLLLDDNSQFTLSDHRGKLVVLYFYPEDDSGGCVNENEEFSALHDEFLQRGALVIGISPNSVESHRKFRAKYRLRVPLAADPDHVAIEGFGLWQLKKLYGREFMGLIRTSFIIGRDGRIARTLRATRIVGHARRVLDALDAVGAATLASD